MDLYAKFGTDKSIEAAGKWMEYGKADDTGVVTAFKIARKGRNNPAFTAAYERIEKTDRRRLENSLMGEEEAFDLMLDVFVEACLLDWKGVNDRDGNAMPFTKAAARQLMIDLPDLYKVLDADAEDLTNFREAKVEADTKN